MYFFFEWPCFKSIASIPIRLLTCSSRVPHHVLLNVSFTSAASRAFPVLSHVLWESDRVAPLAGPIRPRAGMGTLKSGCNPFSALPVSISTCFQSNLHAKCICIVVSTSINMNQVNLGGQSSELSPFLIQKEILPSSSIKIPCIVSSFSRLSLFLQSFKECPSRIVEVTLL